MLCAILIALIVTRLLQARESLWLDELHTAWAATADDWRETARRARDGNHSPLYFWLTAAVTRLLGVSELTVRLPSLIARALLPVALFVVTRRWTGSAWMALLPAWLAAVNPQAIYFGTEARPYALIQLVAVLHVALLVELAQRPTPAKRAGFVFGMALLFHLHYTAGLLLVGELVWLAGAGWTGADRVRYAARELGIDLLAIAAVATIALPDVQFVYGRRANWNAFIDHPSLIGGLQVVPWAVTAVALLASAWTVRVIWPKKLRMSGPGPFDGALALCTAVVVAPYLVAWVASATDAARLVHPRYLATTAPAALLMLSVMLARFPQAALRRGGAIGLCVWGFFASGIPGEFSSHRRLIAFRTDDWRAAVTRLSAEPDAALVPVLLRSLLIESDDPAAGSNRRLEAYLGFPLNSLYRANLPPGHLIALPRSAPWHLPADGLRQLSTASAAWLVIQADSHGADAIAFALRNTLASAAPAAGVSGVNDWSIAAKESFGTVHLVRLTRSSVLAQPR